ncbi:MAG: M56 family metallopeptidase [Acidimicrobiales bacterium]
MTTTALALGTSLLCLVGLPMMLRSSTRFDRSPRVGFAVWGSLCVVGWFSAVVVFLSIGLGDPRSSLLRSLTSFVLHLGDGHPLRGLGVFEVVGLSVAFDITVLMLGGLAVAGVKIWNVRSQQRTVLDLVAEPRDSLEGVCLLNHPYPMAYFLPGDGGRVVLSTGAIDVLSPRELDAVVAHEIGHRSGRHGAFLVPLQVLSSFVSFLPLARYAPTVMRGYLEMSADDYSRSRESSEALKTALTKAAWFQPPPVGALSVNDGVIERRINRLALEPASSRCALALFSGVSVASLLLCLLLVMR